MSFQFCPYCGKSLATINPKYCASCGRPLYSTTPNAPATHSAPTSAAPSVQQQGYEGAAWAAAHLGSASTPQPPPPEQPPTSTRVTINTRLSTAIFLVAVAMTLAAAFIVAVDVAYQLMHFNQSPADLPTWVSAMPPVASFLALAALALHALAARLRKQLQRRLESVYGASALAVALSDLPAWLRWLWPGRQSQATRALGQSQATSTVGRIVSYWLTGVILFSSVGVTVATPRHFFLPSGPSARATLTPGHKLPTGTIKEYTIPTANDKPFDIVAGPDGNVWFDSDNLDINTNNFIDRQIGRITPTDAIEMYPLPPGGGWPGSMTLGPDGNIWFDEYIPAQFGRITPSGAITEYQSPLLSGGSAPSGLVRGPNGNLWFTDVNPTRVGRISQTGVITEFPLPTVNTSLGPIIVGPDGNLWCREEAFDPSSDPSSHPDSIWRITPAGGMTQFSLRHVPINGESEDLVIGPDGNLWFPETGANAIGRITPAGAVTEFPLPTAGSGPFDLTIGPDRNLWFLDPNTGRLGRITPAGAITEFPISNPKAELGLLTLGPDGNFWFQEFVSDRIGRITPAGVVTEFPIPTAKSQPSSLIVGPDGNLWFIEANTNKIGRISP